MLEKEVDELLLFEVIVIYFMIICSLFADGNPSPVTRHYFFFTDCVIEMHTEPTVSFRELYLEDRPKIFYTHKEFLIHMVHNWLTWFNYEDLWYLSKVWTPECNSLEDVADKINELFMVD